MNYITELNKFYYFCISKKHSKSEIALLHALYMINNAGDWAVWFEADNELISRLTGGLSRESIIKARNQLKQKGRIDFKDGIRNVQAAKYMIIPFKNDSNMMEIDEQGNMKVDMKVDKQGDIQVDKEVDEQVDTISKRKPKPNETKNIYCVFFESVWKLYPHKQGKEAVSAKAKQVLHKAGFDLIAKSIENYAAQKPPWQHFMNGSTFFNGRWQEFIDLESSENQTPSVENYGNGIYKNEREDYRKWQN